MRSASAAISSGIRTILGPILATRPNQLWRDITKLKGPAKWTYFYLYVVLDVFSRHVVGWMVGTEESTALAKKPSPTAA